MMAKLKIQDLPESLELDRQAMTEILGGSRKAGPNQRPELNRRKNIQQRLLQRWRKG